MKIDRPALRLFFATALRDGPRSTAEVQRMFDSEREYLRAVYAMSREGFIESRGAGRKAKWCLAKGNPR